MNDAYQMGFSERMLLRDYAFLENLQGRSSHSANLSFAVLSTTVWHFVVAATILFAMSLLLRNYIPPNVNPASASRGVVVTIFLALLIPIGWRIEQIARRYKDARPDIADKFSSSRDRWLWWTTTLSIFAMSGLIALLLTKFHGY